MLPGLYTAVRKSTLGGMIPIYFQGHERMLSAEVNAEKVFEEARRQRSAKFEKHQRRDQEDDDDVDFFGDDSETLSKQGAVNASQKTKPLEPVGGRRKTRVAKSLDELADGDGDMMFELNPNTIKSRSRTSSMNETGSEKKSSAELDAEAAAALEDFKKMLAEQMKAPSTPSRTRRARRRRNGQEGTEEESSPSSNDIGETNGGDSNSNSSSNVGSAEEVTEVKPRRGRRRPVY